MAFWIVCLLLWLQSPPLQQVKVLHVSEQFRFHHVRYKRVFNLGFGYQRLNNTLLNHEIYILH